MVSHGGTDHARHRVQSVPAGPAVAMDSESRDLRQRAKCGLVSRVCEDRDVDVPALRENTAALPPGRGKTWWHPDSCHFRTYLYARIPRVVCGEHGVRPPVHRILRVGDLLLPRGVDLYLY